MIRARRFFVPVFIIAAFSLSLSVDAAIVKPNNNLGLVGWWKFNEGQGTVAKDSGSGGKDGTLVNGTTWAEGKVGKAINLLNASTQYVSTSYVEQLGDFTVCAWFYADGTNVAAARIIDKNFSGGFWIGRSTLEDEKWGGGVKETSSPYGRFVSLTNNAWHHICSRRNGTTHTIYGDGGAVSTSGTVVGTALDSSSLRFGTEYDTPVSHFNGMIDDIRVYSRALLDYEMKAIYNLGSRQGLAKSPGTLSSGLLGHWTFDGPNMIPNVRDISGRANHADLQGQTSTSTVAGRVGQAITLDGVNDYVLGPNIDSIESGDMTLCAWIKPTAFGSNRWIFNQWDVTPAGPAVFLESIGNTAQIDWEIGSYTNVLQSGYIVALNNWQHICTRADDNHLTIYFNGASTTSGYKTRAESLASTPFRIGGSNGLGGVSSFAGDMDDVRVFGRALSSEEISAIYAMGAGGKLNTTQTKSNTGVNFGLVGHYTFDGPNMTPNVRDSSGLGNHGTLAGQTSTTTVPGKIGQAMYFDGVDDLITVPHNAAFNTSVVSFSFWIKSSTKNTVNRFMQKTGDYVLRTTSGVMQTIAGIFFDSNTAVSTEWEHWVFTADGINYKWYRNGVLDKTTARAWTTPSNNQALQIGSISIDPFRGILDDVRIYNRALSASEAAQLYSMGN